MHHPADVSDIVDGLVRCAFMPSAEGRTYNLAGPDPISISDLRYLMAEAALSVRGAGRRSGARRMPIPYPRHLLDLYYHAGRATDSALGLRPPLFESVSFLMADRVLDITRAQRELGFNPRVSVSDGVRRTAEWYGREGLL
jgi:nucleoside-diphosphate-sugar epimerase